MMTIREEEPDDAAAVRLVLESAFQEPLEADLVDELRQTCPERLSLVALTNGHIVGHVLFTAVTIETHDGPIVGRGLAPMAVLPEHQRTGIGSMLVRAGIERLRSVGCPFVVVVGHPEYYPRFGFVPASTHGITCRWAGVPDDAFMVMVLQPGIASTLAGRAVYRPEFDGAA